MASPDVSSPTDWQTECLKLRSENKYLKELLLKAGIEFNNEIEKAKPPIIPIVVTSPNSLAVTALSVDQKINLFRSLFKGFHAATAENSVAINYQ